MAGFTWEVRIADGTWLSVEADVPEIIAGEIRFYSNDLVAAFASGEWKEVYQVRDGKPRNSSR